MSNTTHDIVVKTGNAKKGFSDVEKSSAALAKTTQVQSNKMKKAYSGIGGSIDKLGGQIGGMVGQVARSISGAMKLLMANPLILGITLIVGALAGLVKVFASTDSGGTKLAGIMTGLNNVLDVLRQRMVSVVGAIGKFFSGDWKGAGEDLKAAFTGIGDAMNKANAAGKEFEDTLDRIKDAKSNFKSEKADINNKIARLEYTAADTSQSPEVRKAALKEAIKLGEEVLKIEKGFAKQSLDNEIKNLADKNGVSAAEVEAYIKMTDAEQANASDAMKTFRDNNEAKINELEDLYVTWIDLDTKFFEENKRNVSKLATAERELAKEKQDARDKEAEEKAKAEEDEKARAATAKALAEKQAEETRAIKNEIAVLNKTGLDKELEQLKQGYEDDLKALGDNEEAKLALLEKYRLEGLAIEDKYRAENAAKQKAVDDKAIQDAQEIADAKSAIQQQALNDAFSVMGNMNDAAKQRELAAAGDNAKKKEEIERKYAKKQQAIAIMQAVLNGALAITKATAQTGILAPLAIPAIVAATAGQVAVIASQKFADGGIVSGETLATVGEYAGAKNNPEVIAPLNKLKGMLGDMGGTSGDVTFKIEGDSLVGVLNKHSRKTNSYR